MILVSILLPLVMQPAAPARQVGPVDLQMRATIAHKAYREKAKSAQRCEAQTAAANEMAAKAAVEASRRRRRLLNDLAGSAPDPAPAALVPAPDAGELGRAISLLSRDLEMSAEKLAKTDANPETAPSRGFLAESLSLPQPGALAGADADPAFDNKALFVSILGDMVTEESLLTSYFSSSKYENERACAEKAAPASDPFRMPAEAPKRSRKVKR
jgi:hypothetical protein